MLANSKEGDRSNESMEAVIVNMTSAERFEAEVKSENQLLRERFNIFATANDVPTLINEVLEAQAEMSEFVYEPHVLHMGLDALELISLETINLAFVHRTIDFGYALDDHQRKLGLEKRVELLSERLLITVRNATEGVNAPTNYSQALAKQSLLTMINPFLLSNKYSEDFRNIQNRAMAEACKFSHLHTNSRIQDLEKQNLLSLHYLDEIHRLTTTQQKLTSTDIAHSEEVMALLARLQEQGIVSNDHFAAVLGQSAITQECVRKILTHIEKEQAQNLKRQEAEAITTQYQGVMTACNFLSYLGHETGCKELSIVAIMTHAGAQISQAHNQLSAATSLGIACLNPVSAIGMAVLSVFKSFHRTPDPNLIILKKLQRLTKQMDQMQRGMKEQDQRAHQRFLVLIAKVQTAFEHLYYYLAVPLTRQLADIRGDLELLCEITKQGFEDVLMTDFKKILGVMFDLNHGITGVDMEKEIYIGYLRILRDNYILQQPNLFLGHVYRHLLKPGMGHTSQLIQLLGSMSNEKLQNILGLLLLHTKLILPRDEESLIANVQPFQPEIWSLALATYMQLRQLFHPKFQYDINNVNLELFYKQGQKMLEFLKFLQTSKIIYLELFKRIKKHSNKICTVMQEAIVESKLNLATTLDAEINIHKNQSPQKINYKMPPEYCDESESFVNNLMTSSQLLSQENTLKHLKDKFIPPEFILAEHLGLGHFSYRVCINTPIKHQHHQWRLEKIGSVGVEINFIYKNQEIGLYQPSQPEHSKVKETDEFYAVLISKYTKPVQQFQESCSYIRNIMAQHVLEKRKKLCQKLAELLNNEPSYHELIKCNLFLMTYLYAAGFSSECKQTFSMSCQLTDGIRDYENYVRNATIDTPFPQIKLTSSAEFELLEKNLLNEIASNRKSLRPNILLANISKGLYALQALGIYKDLHASEHEENFESSATSSTGLITTFFINPEHSLGGHGRTTNPTLENRR